MCASFEGFSRGVEAVLKLTAGDNCVVQMLNGGINGGQLYISRDNDEWIVSTKDEPTCLDK
jgi:hypothetical protein